MNGNKEMFAFYETDKGNVWKDIIAKIANKRNLTMM